MNILQAQFPSSYIFSSRVSAAIPRDMSNGYGFLEFHDALNFFLNDTPDGCIREINFSALSCLTKVQMEITIKVDF